MTDFARDSLLETPPMPMDAYDKLDPHKDDPNPNAGLHGLYPSATDAEQGIYEICCRKVLVFQDRINHNVNPERFFVVDFEDLQCVPKELEYRISNEQTNRARKEPIGLLFRDRRNGGKLCLVKYLTD